MKLKLSITLPESPPPHEAVYKPCLEERLAYAVECMETNHETEAAFKFIARVTDCIAKAVAARPPTQKEIQLIKIARPALERYALEGRTTMPDVFWSYFDEINKD